MSGVFPGNSALEAGDFPEVLTAKVWDCFAGPETAWTAGPQY
jgi:hypothetical protein